MTLVFHIRRYQHHDIGHVEHDSSSDDHKKPKRGSFKSNKKAVIINFLNNALIDVWGSIYLRNSSLNRETLNDVFVNIDQGVKFRL